MAERSPQQQDYAAIELLYSEGRWLEVVQRGEALLADLTPPQPSLQARLNLLIGHALLYGLGDRSAAELRYRAVQQKVGEPLLREIAEQGLVRCAEPSQEQPVVAAMPWDPSPDASVSVAQESGSDSPAAMPWMVELNPAGAGAVAAQVEPRPARETAQETLNLLRRTDELLPVTVQVLDPSSPPPGQEDEDLSELARGVLEVQLG